MRSRRSDHPRRSKLRHAERSPLVASSILSRMISWRIPRRSSSGSPPGNEVRLRYAYFIKCTEVVKNAAARSRSCAAPYDPATKGGNAPDGRKVKATMHWLPVAQSRPAEIRVYNQLFAKPSPDAANFAADLNPLSLEILKDARVEAAIAEANSSEAMQFERQGYFASATKISTLDRPVLNRTIGLRDTFAKEVGKT